MSFPRIHDMERNVLLVGETTVWAGMQGIGVPSTLQYHTDQGTLSGARKYFDVMCMSWQWQ